MYDKLKIALFSILIVTILILYKFTISDKVEVYRDGELVNVLVTKIPDCEYVSKYKHEFLEFNFEQQTFSKRLKLRYCRILNDKYFKNGLRSIDILTDKNRKIFVFPFEELKSEIFSFLLIEVIFIICLIRAIVRFKKIIGRMILQ